MLSSRGCKQQDRTTAAGRAMRYVHVYIVSCFRHQASDKGIWLLNFEFELSWTLKGCVCPGYKLCSLDCAFVTKRRIY